MKKRSNKLKFLEEDSDSLDLDSGSNEKSNERSEPLSDQKLHSLVPENSYEALCRRIQKEVNNNYRQNVTNHFPNLLQNARLVNKEFSTEKDTPEQEWRLQFEPDVSNQKIDFECKRLQAKLETLQKEIQTLHDQQTLTTNRLEVIRKHNQNDSQLLSVI